MGGPRGAAAALCAIPVLAVSTTGLPMMKTRTAGTVHKTCTQGGDPLLAREQPTTEWTSVAVTAGIPDRNTRGTAGTGCNSPPWGQVTVAPI